MTRLHFGHGTGNRLLSPGLPDHFIQLHDQRAWILGDVLYFDTGNGIDVYNRGEIAGFAYGPDAWAFAIQTGVSYDILYLTRAAGWKAKYISAGSRCPHVGSSWAVLDKGFERIAIDLATEQPVKIPVGARDAQPQPCLNQKAIAWLDDTRVYRFLDGEKPRLAATLPGRPDWWKTGPSGSALFVFESHALVMSPAGGLKDLPDLAPETVRMTPCGWALMGSTPEGVLLLERGKAETRTSRRGRLIPVGFTSEPVLLDEDSGVLKTWGGTVLGTGFSPSAACVHKNRLYGPGGSSWCLNTSTQSWRDAPLAAAFIVATDGGIIQIRDRIEGFSLDGVPIFNLPLPIDPEIDGDILDVFWIQGLLYFEVDDGWIQVDFEGRRIGNSPPPPTTQPERPPLPAQWLFDRETGSLTWAGTPFPMTIDGVWPSKDGRVYAWSEDGDLYLLSSDTRQ